jgi:hypothetical protein
LTPLEAQPDSTQKKNGAGGTPIAPLRDHDPAFLRQALRTPPRKIRAGFPLTPA